LTDVLHVAIIMDGNGRWAQNLQKNRIAGHQEGVLTLRKIVERCPDEGVRYLTLYVFSSENWKRPLQEVQGLMKLLAYYLKKEVPLLHDKGVCIKVIGQRQRLPKTLQKLIQEAEDLTAQNIRLGLQLAISYGGRDEIVGAAQRLSQQVLKGDLKPEHITAEIFSKELETHPWPDPDLLIRTGGEMRISNYLLWQLSYTELYFSSQYWPDFTPESFHEALQNFKGRTRRFGNIHHA
jgi:undecaprenyl diphosphate synthase